MNGVKGILLASTLVVGNQSALAENVGMQNELQKNKQLVFNILDNNDSSYHVIGKNGPNYVSKENKIYFQEQVLPKIKLPITQDISGGVFKSHTSGNVVGIKYQLSNSQLQREHISVGIGKNNKAEITYSLKF